MSVSTHLLRGSSGLPLRVHLHRPAGAGPHPTVVICHGFKGFANWGFLPWIAESLRAAGHAAVRFDFTHNGVGEDGETFDRLDLFERNRFGYELHDLDVVASTIEAGRDGLGEVLDRDRLHLLGHSRGGGIAILAASEHPERWKRLVTLAAISHVERLGPQEIAILEREGRLPIHNARTGQDMPIGRALLEDVRAHRARYDIATAAARLPQPWLLAHGDADTTVPIEEGRALADAGRRVEALWLRGGSHTLDATHPFSAPSPELEQFAAATIEFLRDA